MRASRTSNVALSGLAFASLAIGCGSPSKVSSKPKSACRTVPAAAPRPDLTKGQMPASSLPAGSVWTATVVTNCGTFSMVLDSAKSPKATAAFVGRIQQGFYDGLSIHRVAPQFVIQGGDPLADGTGGPGYTTVDPPPADQEYPRGTIAMAKSTDQPSGAAGSQFFIVTGEEATLTPDYAVVGSVPAASMTVPDRIVAEGVDPKSSIPGQQPDGPPAHPVVIEKITVVRSS